MGMFDWLKCDYPLPVEGANAISFQTKDTPAQFTDNYEIREDGTLWHEAYDIEDQSDPTKTGVERIVGMFATVNERWEPVPFTGEIRFYGYLKDDGIQSDPEGWIEFSAYFHDGNLKELHQLPGAA